MSQFGIRKFAANQLTRSISRIVATQFWEDLAKGRRKTNQGAILFRSEIILDKLSGLDFSGDRLRAGRTAQKARGENSPIAKTRRDDDTAVVIGTMRVPLAQGLGCAGGIGPNIGDLDAHRT